ncbi:L-threonylcarbamoyladenylate synthase [Rhizomicrobium electricum]|uniref:Threonylcarbamoyl-AMP synthase n=1 Tax=Rhizomicrobium electricum TaxID=480070 RepID=A0ABN1DYN9_9PROT|nr:L-threonylcarbamoyladenylate synthase [Rhizomicrobium electricum]NIJ47214.1 L-threonylcarbamoyladenylate synthase [Rhizomicrobium electricum]
MQPDVSSVRTADAAALAEGGQRLRAGALVAFPTETVYGLGADATNGEAVASIFALKGRPRFNPLIVHVQGQAQAAQHVEFNAAAKALAEAFWPGPLTLVLPRRADTPLSLLVSAGLDTVAVRCPAHPIAQALIAAAGVPLAAPSANPSGTVSPTTARHVAEGFGNKILILDGGETKIGVESTVIGFGSDGAVMLRPGGVPREAIEKIVGPLAAPAAGGPVTSPGMLTSHYAPHARVRLNARTAEPGETLLGFGPDAPADVLNLSRKGDLAEAAAHLFAMLRALDTGTDAIAVMPIPSDGLGEAINDRLKRAAAPRGTHV